VAVGDLDLVGLAFDPAKAKPPLKERAEPWLIVPLPRDNLSLIVANEINPEADGPMQAPTVTDLLNDPSVKQALQQAWLDSLPNDPQRHEEGGWVFVDTRTGAIEVRRAPAGGQATLDLNAPPVVADSVVVATFHTHPNPSAEGWQPGPSAADAESAWILGVPCVIRADDGIHTTGPDSRRGGLLGGPGFPP
jgi:hypothetical protein